MERNRAGIYQLQGWHKFIELVDENHNTLREVRSAVLKILHQNTVIVGMH